MSVSLVDQAPQLQSMCYFLRAIKGWWVEMWVWLPHRHFLLTLVESWPWLVAGSSSWLLSLFKKILRSFVQA